MPSPTQSLASRRAAARSLSTALAPIERRYVAALRNVARAAAAEYMRVLEPHIAARADTRSLPNDLSVLGVHVQLAVEGTVGDLFDRHAKDVAVANARALRVQGIKLAPDAGVAADIAKRRKENIDLVVNAQRAYAESVRNIFSDPANDGLRVEELRQKLLERGDVSESRAELIARDQTLKLNGGITELRQTNAGVTEYTWSTSLDERVREEHAALEGQTFSWDSPPDVGHPGEDFQCRCVAIPVIDELVGLGEGNDPEPPPPEQEPAATIAPPPPEPTLAPTATAQPAGITMTSSFDDDEVRALGARPEGDVAGAAADVFKGRCPDAASWPKVYEPPPGYKVQFKSMSGNRHGFQLAGRVVTSDGAEAGSLNRSFHREGGELVAHHDFFTLVEKYQGRGIGEEMTRSALRSYIEMGVSKVQIDALWTGRYTWAKFGFTWPAEAGAGYERKLARFLRSKLGEADTRVDAFARAALKGAPAVAALEVDGAALGKEFLLDDKYVTGWSGSLHLVDGDVGFEQAKKRLKL